MPPKLPSTLPYLIILSLLLLYLYSTSLLSTSPSTSPTNPNPTCNLFKGQWVLSPTPPQPFYDDTCPFHRNSWNCIRNQRDNMGLINSYQWVPKDCNLERVDPEKFLRLMRNRNIGFIGNYLNENFVVAFLCVLRVADGSAKKWKKKGAWRGGFFPKFIVTVAYHRAVLLAKYEWQPKESVLADDALKGTYRVDVDIPAKEWASIDERQVYRSTSNKVEWNHDKFPKETPLVFYRVGKLIHPPPGLFNGLNIVLDNMISYIKKEFPRKTIKFWLLQSPRHFYGGDWNQNGSCLFNEPLKEHEI